MPDKYTLSARLSPAYIALSPLIVLAVALGISVSPAALGGAAVLAALGLLTSEIVRTAGQRLERELWREWGGGPAQAALRWSGNAAHDVELRHGSAQALGGLVLPSAQEEKADPANADARYNSAVGLLRPLTHDSRYPLVAAENISYGFRRNLLACRPAAETCAAVALIAAVVCVLVRDGALVERLGALWLPIAWCVFLVVVLRVVVSKAWVKAAAQRYADQLLAAAALAAKSKS